MFKDWLNVTRALIIRLRLQEPLLVARPRFQATSIALWVTAIAGLIYGHLARTGEASRPVSLLLSMVAAAGAVFLILLRDPKVHLRVFGRQIWGLLWLIAFGFGLFVLGAIWSSPATSNSVKVFWTTATVLVGANGVRLALAAYVGLDDLISEYYPGMRGASVLVALLIINYLIWQFKPLVGFIR